MVLDSVHRSLPVVHYSNAGVVDRCWVDPPSMAEAHRQVVRVLHCYFDPLWTHLVLARHLRAAFHSPLWIVHRLLVRPAFATVLVARGVVAEVFCDLVLLSGQTCLDLGPDPKHPTTTADALCDRA
jgi:hypothetical protein